MSGTRKGKLRWDREGQAEVGQGRQGEWDKKGQAEVGQERAS